MDHHILMMKANQLGLYDIAHLTDEEIEQEVAYASLSKEARNKTYHVRYES